MYAVPTMMHRIWRLPEAERTRHDLSSLRVVFHMAAPCPVWLKEAWIEWLGPDRILELYGGTEAQSFTVITGGEWLEHRGSVGRSLMGEMRILDAEGRELPPGEVGEIWMRRGEDAAPSYRYVGAKAKTRPGNWESLGDLGSKDAEGYIYLSDRETDMILVGGANVYPAEIEAALDEHPGVTSSCVIGLPDEEYGNVVHAIVQAARPLAAAELEEFLGARLAKYKRPRTYEFVATPLRGDDGKVRRTVVRSWELTDLHPKEKVESIRHSVSSRYWRCAPLHFVDPGQKSVYVAEALGGSFVFTLASGAVAYTAGTRTECTPPDR
jgi:bile acid-coenzyme A ligase